MRDWGHVRIDTGIEVFFCDPHSPWHRDINENTNGLAGSANGLPSNERG